MKLSSGRSMLRALLTVSALAMCGSTEATWLQHPPTARGGDAPSPRRSLQANWHPHKYRHDAEPGEGEERVAGPQGGPDELSSAEQADEAPQPRHPFALREWVAPEPFEVRQVAGRPPRGPDPALHSHLKALLPDAAEALPAAFLEEYKNPCWAAQGGGLHCLPYFYILGVYQCGPVDLWRRIGQHPEVASSNPAANNYFFEKRPFEEVLKGMAPVSRAIGEAEQGRRLVAGDASGATFTFTWTHNARVHIGFDETIVECWKQCHAHEEWDEEQKRACVKGPEVEHNCFRQAQAADKARLRAAGGEIAVPHLVRAVLGRDTPRFVILLRNPADRYYAAFQHYPQYALEYGPGMAGFEAFVRAQAQAFQRCLETAAVRTCVLYFESLGPDTEAVFYHADQLIKGMYAAFLEDWLVAFPREAFLVVKAEEYYADPRPVLLDVMKHLDLSEPSEELLESMSKPRGKHDPPEFARGLPEDMSAEARAMLDEVYAPFNEKLAQLLGDDRFLWK